MQDLLEDVSTLNLPSGRTLSWKVYGGALEPTSGTEAPAVIFYFHGFPGCCIEGSFIETEHLQQLNARCIAMDRPGTGKAGYYAERRILDWPGDVLAVADHLHVRQFYVLGVSGGGPYALACAHSIPRADGPESQGRLRGVAIASGLYPVTLPTEGMLLELKVLLAAGAWLPRFMTGAMLDFSMGRPARNKDPKVLEDTMDKVMAQRSESERTAWAKPKVRTTAIESLRGAFWGGGQAMATELMLLHDWGFEIGDIEGKGLRLWHGKLDRNVPFGMAEKAAELMPGVQTRFSESDGHLSMSAGHVEEILEDLLNGRV